MSKWNNTSNQTLTKTIYEHPEKDHLPTDRTRNCHVIWQPPQTILPPLREKLERMEMNDLPPTPRTDSIISAINMDEAYQDLCRTLERELYSMTQAYKAAYKDAEDARLAHKIIAASYKKLTHRKINEPCQN